MLWAAGAATAVVACGLIGFWVLGGSNEVATLPATVPVADVSQAEPVEPNSNETLPLPDAPDEATESAETNESPIPPAVQEEIAAVEPAAPPATSPPPPIASVATAKPELPRTLTLEPVAEMATSPMSAVTPVKTPDYSPAVENEPIKPVAKPPAAEPPQRVTNLKDRLSLPIESIDLPKMRIGEFVNLMSTMTAVRIELDAKVLGDVGLSSRSTVTVQDERTTAGKLLARVLKEHRLTCVERDGTLVVVRAKSKQ